MKNIALNYIYLSKSHAGGKDQVGLNLLKGFYKNGMSKNMIVICFDYSEEIILKIAPDIKTIVIRSRKVHNELERMAYVCYVNTFMVPKVIQQNGIDLIYHLSCNNGLNKLNSISVVIPHDIKAVAHRTLANVKIPFYKYWLYRIMYYIDFKNADHIIAISDVDKNEISQHYPKFMNKVKRIYNPIDFDKDCEQVERDNYICAVNLQFHHKNIITLIKAFELIKEQVDSNLYLIGKVPDRVKYLKDYVEQHNLQDRIIFTGFVSDDEMKNLFQKSRLYVNPTLYEGFGMTAVEAMISKIPTLVSKIPTNYEVTKGLCEYYSPPENESELAKAIVKCLNTKYSDDDLDEISTLIFEAYRYDKVSREYYDFFNALLEG